MYLFFKTVDYFFSVSTGIIKRIFDYQVDVLKDQFVIFEGSEYELFFANQFINAKYDKDFCPKNILMIQTLGGYRYGLAIEDVFGFFSLNDIKPLSKADILNRYGFFYIDFATLLDNRLIFSIKNEYFDKRYEELTCQTEPI